MTGDRYSAQRKKVDLDYAPVCEDCCHRAYAIVGIRQKIVNNQEQIALLKIK
jgi:hypothetical protein